MNAVRVVFLNLFYYLDCWEELCQASPPDRDPPSSWRLVPLSQHHPHTPSSCSLLPVCIFHCTFNTRHCFTPHCCYVVKSVVVLIWEYDLMLECVDYWSQVCPAHSQCEDPESTLSTQPQMRSTRLLCESEILTNQSWLDVALAGSAATPTPSILAGANRCSTPRSIVSHRVHPGPVLSSCQPRSAFWRPAYTPRISCQNSQAFLPSTWYSANCWSKQVVVIIMQSDTHHTVTISLIQIWFKLLVTHSLMASE